MDSKYAVAVKRLKGWDIAESRGVGVDSEGVSRCSTCGSVLDDGRIMEWDDTTFKVHKAIRMFWCPKCRLKEGSTKPAMRHIEYAKTWEDGV